MDKEFHMINLQSITYLSTRDKREQIVAQCGQGGGSEVTHRWRVVHIDADGVLGGEAILGVRRPHFIGRCKELNPILLFILLSCID